MTTTHCDRCPLKRHRRPCQLGALDRCDLLDTPGVRHSLIAANGDAAAVAGLIERADRTGNALAVEAPPLSVAVVVPCHNYGRYLAECLESVLSQTAPPAEVLVVDDASTDDTEAVAAGFAARGVRYLRVEHRHVHRTRESGFHATAADILLFLDADNKLPPDYLEKGLPLFADRRVGLVYSDLQSFGTETGLTRAADFDPRRLETGPNYIDACALVTRQALTIARAFENPSADQSHADWRLWQKVVDAGFTAVRQPAPCLYRRHPAQMIRTAPRDYWTRAGLDKAEVTLFIPLSGRRTAWDSHLRPWLDAQTWPKAQTRLVLADTSQDPDFGAMVRAWLRYSDYFEHDARYYRQNVGTPGLADAPRGRNTDEVNDACRQIYARAARELATPWLQVVEDDHRPPNDLIERLLRSMDEQTGAVSGLYRSRFQAGGGYVVWMPGVKDGHPLWPKPGGPVIEVGGTGFGSLLLRRSVLRGETFAKRPGDSEFYDVAFANRKTWRWKLDPSVLVEHYGAPPLCDKTKPSTGAAYLLKAARVRQCPHWSKEGCGCSEGRCALGKGREGLVRFEECFGCLGL